MKKVLHLLLLPVLFTMCTQTSSDVPDVDKLALTWEFKGNQTAESYYESVFVIENLSNQVLGESGWSLFFNQMGSSSAHRVMSGNVQVEHINGDLFRLFPVEGFSLESGKSAEIVLRKGGWLIKEVEAPLGPYFVFESGRGDTPKAIAVEDYTILPFPELGKIFTPEAGLPVPDAAWVYEQNKNQVKLNKASLHKVLPTPAQQTVKPEEVELGEGLMVHYSGALESEANYLSEMLEQVLGFPPAVMESDRSGPNIIYLEAGNKSADMGEEAYSLDASKGGGVVIHGSGSAGVFYGIQSLLAMLPVDNWSKPGAPVQMEGLHLTDNPAFSYRGMQLDIARNFIPLEDIRKLIRIMAFYKLNTLHLHVTDDEAWRLEIPGFPELTEVGSLRGHTVTSKDHLHPAYGSGPVPDPESGYGSGYISRAEFIELLKFAATYHVDIIPEVNFPGHSRAAIYAMENRYDRFMKEGKKEEAEKYRLIDPDNTSRYLSAQNYIDNVVCVCKESPYLFYEAILDEILAMYNEAGLELEIMHAGGDEVPSGAWNDSPICQEFLAQHPEISGPENLQAYCEGRLFEILKKKGLVMGGWEEIAMKKDENGRWIPNPEFAGQQMLPYVWNSKDDYLDLGNRLANAGYPVILCNVTNFYFDLAYNHHPAEPGHYWGGFVNTRKGFEFAPYDVFASTISNQYWIPYNPETDFAGMERLKPEARKNIKGLQAQLWSETLKGGTMMEYYYLPKLISFSERAWSGQEPWAEIRDLDRRVAAIQESWNRFANAIGQREMPRLDYLFNGFNYRLPPPGALLLDGKLHANIEFPGLEVRYTTDGSEPDQNSPVYSSPVESEGPVKLRSFDTRGRGSRISVVE